MFVELEMVVPEIALTEAQFVAAIEAELRREIEIDERLLRRTHSTWSTPVGWHKDFGRLAAGGLYGSVETNDDKYVLVTLGARPHQIVPRRQPALHFQRNYRAKTRPRTIASRAGGKFGRWVSRRAVQHPGHAARLFHEEIARRRQPHFTKNMTKAMRTAAHKFFTGYGAKLRRRRFMQSL